MGREPNLFRGGSSRPGADQKGRGRVRDQVRDPPL